MKANLNRVLTVTVISLLAFASASAQRRAAREVATSPGGSLLASLPPSDAVALVDVKRVFDEAVPKLLADNPARLADVTNELAKLKSDTGLDVRSFNQVAVGLSYQYPRPGITKMSTIALARGTFNPAALVAAGRIAGSGKYIEQNYQGKTIYVFTLDRELRLFGVWDVNVHELAATVLDPATLAIGDVEAVRGAIDSNRSRRHANPELISLASRDPNAIVSFGGNISATLLDNLRLGNDSIRRDLTAVRQVYGTLGMTATDLEVMLTARTVDQYAARNLGDTVEGLKQLGALFVNRLTPIKSALARTALDNLKVNASGNEVELRTSVAQSQVTPLIRGAN